MHTFSFTKTIWKQKVSKPSTNPYFAETNPKTKIWEQNNYFSSYRPCPETLRQKNKQGLTVCPIMPFNVSLIVLFKNKQINVSHCLIVATISMPLIVLFLYSFLVKRTSLGYDHRQHSRQPPCRTLVFFFLLCMQGGLIQIFFFIG